MVPAPVAGHGRSLGRVGGPRRHPHPEEGDLALERGHPPFDVVAVRAAAIAGGIELVRRWARQLTATAIEEPASASKEKIRLTRGTIDSSAMRCHLRRRHFMA